MKRIFIGVDGGGSKTVALAAAEDGTVLALGRGSGINYNNIGFDRARKNLRDVINLLPDGVKDHYTEICVGMPALDRTADIALVRKFAADAFDPERLDMQSDLYVALMGLTLGEPGMIAVCGTGSMLLMLDTEGKQRVRSGWGSLFRDAGAGYSIAVDGLRAAIDSWEKVGSETVLTDAAVRYFDLAQPRQLIDRIYGENGDVDRIAGFASEVLRASADGDSVSVGILKSHMLKFSREALALLREAPEVKTVGMFGGILLHSAIAQETFKHSLLSACSDLNIRLPEYQPEMGALIHSFRKYGLLSEEKLMRMQTTYAALRGHEEEKA